MDEQTLEAIRKAVDERGWLDQAEAMEPYLREHRGHYHGRAAAVVRPADTESTARVVQACADGGIPIVPQSGNTGLSGGAAPHEHGREIILSLDRMTRIRDVDAANYTLTAEAGCILADVQNAAAEADRLFPLSLASEGTCRIGGNLATNAGGTNVLRYGHARALTLGLEVVLADGRVWNGLSRLRKDNTGYDLKSLFIGAEGTLGIITAATLQLFPRPVDSATALIALDNPEAAVQIFSRLRAASGDTFTSCELMCRFAVELALKHAGACRDPFADGHPWYLLVEFTSSRADAPLRQPLESVLGEELEAGHIRDAVIAENQSQADDLWRIRETIPEAQTREGGSIKHDISVPVSNLPAFIDEAVNQVEAALPGIRPCPFGHVGDGNIHFNLSQPVTMDKQAFLARWQECNEMVFDMVARHHGSISAEHGIGQLNRDALARYKPREAVAIMRSIKQALDPDNLMNPGKVIPDSGNSGPVESG